MATNKRYLFLILIVLGFVFQQNSFAQIEDIKDKSDENKKNKDSTTTTTDDGDSDNDIAEGCVSALTSSCFEIGCSVFSAVLGEYTAYVYGLKPTTPSILSLDIEAGFAPGYHFADGNKYRYMNYLPALRGNLAAFMIEFRGNLLTEISDSGINSFNCLDLVLGFNIVPNEQFMITLGMGMQREMDNNMYFHEYYVGSKIGLNQNRDYLRLVYRASVDYETKVMPFQEAAIDYNFRLIDIDPVFIHFMLGGTYQNYYQSHDIWALRAGIAFNLH